MPSAVNIQGTVTRRPGVYAEVDASQLAGRVLNTNIVGVVMPVPVLQQAEPQRFNTPAALKALDPLNADLQEVTRTLYNAAADDRVLGGPTAVVLVSPQTTTQAEYTFQNAFATDCLKLKSKLWGTEGNKISVDISDNAVDSTLRDITIQRPGFDPEEYVGLGSGPVIYIYHTSLVDNELDGFVGTINVTMGASVVQVAQQINALTGGTLVVTEMAADGIVTLMPSGVGNHTAKITGLRKDGTTLDEDLVWTASAAPMGAVAWARIDTIVWTPDTAETLQVNVDAFNLSSAEFPFAQDVVDRVNMWNSRSYFAVAQSPRAAVIEVVNLDGLLAVEITGSTVSTGGATIRADRQAIYDTLFNSSALVLPELLGAHTGPPIAIGAPVNLTGGTQSAVGTADYLAAFNALKSWDVQILWTDSEDAVVHGHMRDHCQFMAGAGGNERNGWVGTAPNLTKANLLPLPKALNTRHVSMCPQQVQMFNRQGIGTLFRPPYAALVMTGIQAGTPVATPLTRKRPNIIKFVDGADWAANDDANELLENGLAFFTTDRLGPKVERSITTYLTDDNPIFSEVSSNESINTSIRDLRANLEIQIGEPGFQSTAANIQSIAKTVLRQQVIDGIIKAFNEAGVTVEDLGDVFRVNYEVSAVEPVNFILATATVVRTPFSAI